MTPLAETLDALLRLKPPTSWEHRGTMRPPGPRLSMEHLYRAARRVVGAPLADAAAEALLARVRPGSRVIVTTGLVTPHIPRGETDGPSGALTLARAVILARRARVVLFTEPQVVPVLEAGVEALGGAENDGQGWESRLRIRPFPTDGARAMAAGRRLVRAEAPAALVSIEKLGPNARGVIHTMRGEDVTRYQARTDALFGLASERGILTVGIGDRGNEIGMGGLLRRMARCACACGGSIACAVAARFPVAAFTSNWGAHAVTAAMAGRLGLPHLLPRPRSEARMLRRMVRAGAMDGATRRREPTVDGSGLALQVAFLGLLHALLNDAPRP
jgi:hypothetical protein